MNQDPGGYADTIDPALPVLRVDKLVQRGGRVVREPIGAWTDFANHGTIVEHTFAAYGGDHQAVAERVFEAAVRRAGHVPPGQAVVNAFADGAEGDMSSGLVHNGPAWAVHIGTLEAQAMLRGWRAAGAHMTRRLAIDYRWTRSCFCGHTVKGGAAVDTKAVIGLPVFTGSEEGRGPLYDATGVSFEGRHLPVSVGPQGDKIPVIVDSNHQDDPPAVPIQVVRIGDHLLAAVPGEPTVEMGRRMRTAIQAATQAPASARSRSSGSPTSTPTTTRRRRSSSIRTTKAGTPCTECGRLLHPRSARRPRRAVGPRIAGAGALRVYPTNGIIDDGAPLSGRLLRHARLPAGAAQPVRDTSSWFTTARGITGGLKYAAARYICLHYDLAARSVGASTARRRSGLGTARLERSRQLAGRTARLRPTLGRAFVTVERLGRGGQWEDVADDLGYEILWTVDSNGVYRAVWQAPVDAPLGRYRFLDHRQPLHAGLEHVRAEGLSRADRSPGRHRRARSGGGAAWLPGGADGVRARHGPDRVANRGQRGDRALPGRRPHGDRAAGRWRRVLRSRPRRRQDQCRQRARPLRELHGSLIDNCRIATLIDQPHSPAPRKGGRDRLPSPTFGIKEEKRRTPPTEGRSEKGIEYV